MGAGAEVRGGEGHALGQGEAGPGLQSLGQSCKHSGLYPEISRQMMKAFMQDSQVLRFASSREAT